MQPQLTYGSSPANIHLSINPASVRWVDAMLADLVTSVEAARASPSGVLGQAITDEFAGIDPTTWAMTPCWAARAGRCRQRVPADRMADVNEVFDALPLQLRERLRVEYHNVPYR